MLESSNLASNEEFNVLPSNYVARNSSDTRGQSGGEDDTADDDDDTDDDDDDSSDNTLFEIFFVGCGVKTRKKENFSLSMYWEHIIVQEFLRGIEEGSTCAGREQEFLREFESKVAIDRDGNTRLQFGRSGKDQVLLLYGEIPTRSYLKGKFSQLNKIKHLVNPVTKKFEGQEYYHINKDILREVLSEFTVRTKSATGKKDLCILLAREVKRRFCKSFDVCKGWQDALPAEFVGFNIERLKTAVVTCNQLGKKINKVSDITSKKAAEVIILLFTSDGSIDGRATDLIRLAKKLWKDKAISNEILSKRVESANTYICSLTDN